MSDQNEKFTLEIQATDNKCPIGETTGKDNLKNNKIPVLSCEGLVFEVKSPGWLQIL